MELRIAFQNVTTFDNFILFVLFVIQQIVPFSSPKASDLNCSDLKMLKHLICLFTIIGHISTGGDNEPCIIASTISSAYIKQADILLAAKQNEFNDLANDPAFTQSERDEKYVDIIDKYYELMESERTQSLNELEKSTKLSPMVWNAPQNYPVLIRDPLVYCVIIEADRIIFYGIGEENL